MDASSPPGRRPGVLDASLDISFPAADADNSLNYQTADEDGSRYFSVIEDESTLEEVSVDGSSVRDEPDRTLTETNDVADRPKRREDAFADLSNINIEAVDKFHIHEKIEAANILSGGVDIFDDNESSVDANELVIDDDPHQSENTDEFPESGPETSADVPYKTENRPPAVVDEADRLPRETRETPEAVVSGADVVNVEVVSQASVGGSQSDCRVDLKDLIGDFEDNGIKSENYNFPEGSHRATIQIDGNQVEAINIGQEIYIYTDSNGVLTSFQILKDDDGNVSVKYLHVGKNEDGNIEVYEEQVNQVVVSSDENAPLKENERFVESIPKKSISPTKSDISLVKNSVSSNDNENVFNIERDSVSIIQSNSVDSETISGDKVVDGAIPHRDTPPVLQANSEVKDDTLVTVQESPEMHENSISADDNISLLKHFDSYMENENAKSKNCSRNDETSETAKLEIKPEMKINEDVKKDSKDVVNFRFKKSNNILKDSDYEFETTNGNAHTPNKVKDAGGDESDRLETVDLTENSSDLPTPKPEPNADAKTVVDVRNVSSDSITSDTPKNDSSNTRSSADSDDDFSDVVEWQPVTGDCEENAWNDSKFKKTCPKSSIESRTEPIKDESKALASPFKVTPSKPGGDPINYNDIVSAAMKEEKFKLSPDKSRTILKPLESTDDDVSFNSGTRNNLKVYSVKKPTTPFRSNCSSPSSNKSKESMDDDDIYNVNSLKIDHKTYAVKTYSKDNKNRQNAVGAKNKFFSNVTSPTKIGVINTSTRPIILVADPDALSELNDVSEFPKLESDMKNKGDSRRSNDSKFSPKPGADASVKNKVRQPRKQILTPVAISEEIVFPATVSNQSDFSNFSKFHKTYSKTKFKSLESSPVQTVDKTKKDSEESPIEKEDVDLNASSTSLHDTSGKLKTSLSTSVDDNETSSSKDQNGSSVSDSPKRRRGRPKKNHSPAAETVSPSKFKTTQETPLPAPDVDKQRLVENKNNLNKSIDSVSVKESSGTGGGEKRKGRPKKNLSTSLTVASKKSTDAVKVTRSSHNFSHQKEENVCPICSKNFRSNNVLVKHAKHCNGIIEVVKSPRQKRTSKVESGEKFNSSPRNDDVSSANVPTPPLEIDETETSSVKDDESKDPEESIIKEIIKKSLMADAGEQKRIMKIQEGSKPLQDDSDSKDTTVDRPESAGGSEKDESSNDKTDEETKKPKNYTVSAKTAPVKSVKDRLSKKSMPSPMSRLSKILNLKPPNNNKVIKCEICGKIFRQLAHMVYHRKKHDVKNANVPKSSSPAQAPAAAASQSSENNKEDRSTDSDAILKCEICKKGFRKLHHLVEHREVHANNEVKPRRTSVASVKSEPEAGFRCEACDKSFRKLHHLVQHREMHLAESVERRVSDTTTAAATTTTTKDSHLGDEECTCTCGRTFRKRHHMVEHRDVHCSPSKLRKENDGLPAREYVRLSINSSTSEDSNNCGICGKSYRKLHHMVEHRESHGESTARSGTEDTASASEKLIAKDIIHECQRCYMVFPNLNALNKHVYQCMKRKTLRRSAANHNIENRPTSMISKRKSSDSSTNSGRPLISKTTNVNVENNMTSRRSVVSKLPTRVPSRSPSALRGKRTKTPEDDGTKDKDGVKTDTVLENDDEDDEESDVKYKINTNFAAKHKPNSVDRPIAAVVKRSSSVKPRRSETVDRSVHPKDLEELIEETTVKYSFPKTPKSREKAKVIDLVTPKTPNKTRLPKSVASRKSLFSAPKSPPKHPPRGVAPVVAKRRSIGGRKSLDARKLPVVKKLQLRCCNKTFDSQASMAVHRRTHKVASKPHSCDCGKKFENEILLRRHMDSEHTPPKSFKCQTCGVSLRTAAQYAKHRSTHNAATAASKTSVDAFVAPTRVKKTLRMPEPTSSSPEKRRRPSATPATDRKKPRAVHGGVPLSDKMRRVLSNAKF